jgi:hypothetical protein
MRQCHSRAVYVFDLRDGSLVLPHGQSSLTRDDLNDTIEFLCIELHVFVCVPRVRNHNK